MKENNHTTQQNTFELLAPAGSLAIFKAVVAAGADAVYVGGSKFGARAYADNFSDEELLEALDYAHLYGRRVYLTVNTLFLAHGGDCFAIYQVKRDDPGNVRFMNMDWMRYLYRILES